MNVRNANLEDLENIQIIYEYARKLMRESGNKTQWINGYPQKELLEEDIRNANCYVVEDKKDIVAVFMLFKGDEPTYKNIYNGAWVNDAPYGTIHRLAATGKVKGMASFCIDWCLNQCENIRIDTHADNKIMQHILEKKDFIKCGTIYVDDGTPRLAYQKVNHSN